MVSLAQRARVSMGFETFDADPGVDVIGLPPPVTLVSIGRDACHQIAKFS
jgi:hypothetical protein